MPRQLSCGESSASALTGTVNPEWRVSVGANRRTRTLSEPDGICSSGVGQHPATALAPHLAVKRPTFSYRACRPFSVGCLATWRLFDKLDSDLALSRTGHAAR